MKYTSTKHPLRPGYVIEFANGHKWSVVDLKQIMRDAGTEERMIEMMFPWGGIEGMRYKASGDGVDGDYQERGATFEEVFERISEVEEGV